MNTRVYRFHLTYSSFINSFKNFSFSVSLSFYSEFLLVCIRSNCGGTVVVGRWSLLFILEFLTLFAQLISSFFFFFVFILNISFFFVLKFSLESVIHWNYDHFMEIDMEAISSMNNWKEGTCFVFNMLLSLVVSWQSLVVMLCFIFVYLSFWSFAILDFSIRLLFIIIFNFQQYSVFVCFQQRSIQYLTSTTKSEYPYSGLRTTARYGDIPVIGNKYAQFHSLIKKRFDNFFIDNKKWP